MRALRVATYNIHKGFSFLNRRLVVHELREKLRTLAADIVFLQEVHSNHDHHAECGTPMCTMAAPGRAFPITQRSSPLRWCVHDGIR